ncbi:MAG: response regulator transcription factor [Pseudomonadota bacterium]
MAQFRYGLVVDDHPDALQWVTSALSDAYPDLDIATAHSLESARYAVATCAPDIALIDIGLPDGSGIDLITELHRSDAESYKIVSTIFGDDKHLFEALRAGAQGYVLKDESQAELSAMLKGIVAGTPPLSASVARRLLNHFHHPVDLPEVHLTERENEVLTLLAKGYTVQRVADLLDITANTTAGYVKNIYRKLNVSNRAEAAMEASRRGLVSPESI